MKDWLDKFRDDPELPRWLDRFRDDPVKRKPPRKERQPASSEVPQPAARPGSSPRSAPKPELRPQPKPQPKPQTGSQPGSQPRPQPKSLSGRLHEAARAETPRPPQRGPQRPQVHRPEVQPPRPRAQPPKPQQPGRAAARSHRPLDILLFAALMSLSLVLGLAIIAIVYPGLAELAPPVQILLPDILVISITGTFIYLVAELRQQWAAWMLAVFCAVRLVMYLPTFWHIAAPGLQLLTSLYFVLQAAALWFLFTPAARRWLKNR